LFEGDISGSLSIGQNIFRIECYFLKSYYLLFVVSCLLLNLGVGSLSAHAQEIYREDKNVKVKVYLTAYLSIEVWLKLCLFCLVIPNFNV